MSQELARLIAGQIFLHACMAGMRMATPLLALKQGYSAMAVGALLSLFALTQVFLAIPAGRYTDRHGLKKPLRFSIAIASIGAMLSAIWPVFPMLCVSALASGGATGMTVIALQRHVGRSAKDGVALKTAFSWLSIGPAISNFLGPVVAGLLIDHAGTQAADTTGFQVAFAAMALLPLVTWFWVRHVQEHLIQPAPDNAAPRNALDLLREPLMRRLLMVNWLLSSCWDVHTFVVPILGHERGFSASVVGTILGSFAMAAAFIRVCLPWLARHVHEHQIITFAMVATGLLFGLYPWLPNAWAMGACSVTLGLVLGSVQPMIMSTLHQITPAHRQGEALGLRLMSINASSVLMPTLFGAAGAIAGVAPVFWVVGTAVGWGSLLAWKLRPERTHSPSS
ncbi:MFS transporter [Limnohabitans sp. T6-5]|uniref:MFS transporter n=1 Tax=Limnohabitans sp. T6-5 TaxID=1100724 RepID=UPI000D35A854|nr:MFS transporter [Limnohabitans sp. T6-5]PUE07171.1 MFS transporter [Limnohabitans sp. T6-5]